jgi:hypothetical protein
MHCSIFFGYMLSFINSYLITRIHVKGPGNKNFHYQDEGIKQFMQILLTRSQLSRQRLPANDLIKENDKRRRRINACPCGGAWRSALLDFFSSSCHPRDLHTPRLTLIPCERLSQPHNTCSLSLSLSLRTPQLGSTMLPSRRQRGVAAPGGVGRHEPVAELAAGHCAGRCRSPPPSSRHQVAAPGGGARCRRAGR